MDLTSQTGELKAKLALIGVPNCGQRQILQDWSKQLGKGELFHERVSEVSVYRAPFRWNDLPKPGWTLRADAFTTHGEVSYSAVQEMLLDVASA